MRAKLIFLYWIPRNPNSDFLLDDNNSTVFAGDHDLTVQGGLLK